jgi:hypothetical protein
MLLNTVHGRGRAPGCCKCIAGALMRTRGTIGAAATLCHWATPTATPSRLTPSRVHLMHHLAAGLRGGRPGRLQSSWSNWTTPKVRHGKSRLRARPVRPKLRARHVRTSLTHPSRRSHRARSPHLKRRKLGRRSTSAFAQGARAEPCG